jgi:hypothetical protein
MKGAVGSANFTLSRAGRKRSAARAVVVRGPHVEDPAADPLDHFVVQPEDRRHRTRVLLRGVRHGQAPLSHEADRLLDPEGTRGRKSGELADRVAHDEVGLDSSRANRSEDREARRNEGRLLHLCLDKFRLGSLEAEAPQIEARCLAAEVEDLHHFGHGAGKLAAHADLERALAREAEGDEPGLHAVHCISAEPQVSPAPIPVINTMFPSLSRPSLCASARASGIEPEDVFPNRSTLTTIRSRGIPNFWAA